MQKKTEYRIFKTKLQKVIIELNRLIHMFFKLIDITLTILKGSFTTTFRFIKEKKKKKNQ